MLGLGYWRTKEGAIIKRHSERGKKKRAGHEEIF